MPSPRSSASRAAATVPPTERRPRSTSCGDHGSPSPRCSRTLIVPQRMRSIRPASCTASSHAQGTASASWSSSGRAIPSATTRSRSSAYFSSGKRLWDGSGKRQRSWVHRCIAADSLASRMDFTAVPASIERLLRGTAGGLPGLPERCERVGVVLLDAFGRRFLERHADHPFLRRLAVTELRAQFPSTTTSHITTMHTGRPLTEHGLYEWNIYEPALGAIVTPLRLSDAR